MVVKPVHTKRICLEHPGQPYDHIICAEEWQMSCGRMALKCHLQGSEILLSTHCHAHNCSCSPNMLIVCMLHLLIRMACFVTCLYLALATSGRQILI